MLAAEVVERCHQDKDVADRMASELRGPTTMRMRAYDKAGLTKTNPGGRLSLDQRTSLKGPKRTLVPIPP